ncbi:MAG: SocA family protein [Clostridiales bacterium]|jgi:uncharacterized phage-associated protein|nr:SocA family protein [Clostridiales bacterium]
MHETHEKRPLGQGGKTRINEAKYENAILYFCSQLGGALRGRKKLAKLLYYADFDSYEYKESMQSVTGDSYTVLEMGPVPDNYKSVLLRLARAGQIEISRESEMPGGKPTEVYALAHSAAPNMLVFSEDERFVLARVAKKYGRLNGRQLEALTHAEAPYLATEPNCKIEYGLAFYRGTDFADAV